MSTYAFFGAGVMGEALLAALLRSGVPATEVLVVEKRAERAAEIEQAYGVHVVDAAAAAARADIAVLVVKPQDMAALLSEVGHLLRPGALVVSIAAGITTAALEASVTAGVSCVRAMPNTPALIGEGMTGISPGTGCAPEGLETARRLLSLAGRVVVVPEDQQEAVTAVSGSGPAYVFWLAEALRDAGVGLGLSEEDAAVLVEQTLVGAAAMLRQTGEDPGVLRERVTSPGGTTAAALAVLCESDGRGMFERALRANAARSRELAGGMPTP